MAKRTIKLKKYSDIRLELIAHEAIKPGQLVELRSDGKVQKHAGTKDYALPMFAVEDELQGKTIDDNYAEGDPVQVWIPGRGDEVLALLYDGENAGIADALVSAGTGDLREQSSEGGEDIIAQAIEAVNLSSSSGTYPDTEFRIAVRIV